MASAKNIIALRQKQQELGIKDHELDILADLSEHAYSAMADVADRIGVLTVTIRRHFSAMRKAKLILRIPQDDNPNMAIYRVSPKGQKHMVDLVAALEDVPA